MAAIGGPATMKLLKVLGYAPANAPETDEEFHRITLEIATEHVCQGRTADRMVTNVVSAMSGRPVNVAPGEGPDKLLLALDEDIKLAESTVEVKCLTCVARVKAVTVADQRQCLACKAQGAMVALMGGPPKLPGIFPG